MKPNLIPCVLLLALAVVGCASPQEPARQLPRAQIPALPVDLAVKKDPSIYCQELLQAFSAPPDSLRKVCGEKMP